MKKYICYAIGVMLLIPVLLNFLLPIKTGLNIIKQDDLWLSFWATYLSACASAIMAAVSWWMNKNATEQNQKMQDNEAWQRLVERYNKIEKFVVEQERIHHPNWIYVIRTMECDDSKIQPFLCQRERLLLSSSKFIRRYLEDEYAYQIQNNTSKALYSYGLSLKQLNDLYLALTKSQIKQFTNNKEDNLQTSGTTKENDKIDVNINSSFMEFEIKGDELLKEEKQRLLNFAKERNMDCGVI